MVLIALRYPQQTGRIRTNDGHSIEIDKLMVTEPNTYVVVAWFRDQVLKSKP